MEEFTVGDTVSVNNRVGKVKEIYMTNSAGIWLPWITIKGEHVNLGFYGDDETLKRVNFQVIERIPRT